MKVGRVRIAGSARLDRAAGDQCVDRACIQADFAQHFAAVLTQARSGQYLAATGLGAARRYPHLAHATFARMLDHLEKSGGLQLRVGKELYSDALGPVGSGAETYIGMMKHNFDAVAEALSGG